MADGTDPKLIIRFEDGSEPRRPTDASGTPPPPANAAPPSQAPLSDPADKLLREGETAADVKPIPPPPPPEPEAPPPKYELIRHVTPEGEFEEPFFPPASGGRGGQPPEPPEPPHPSSPPFGDDDFDPRNYDPNVIDSFAYDPIDDVYTAQAVGEESLASAAAAAGAGGAGGGGNAAAASVAGFSGGSGGAGAAAAAGGAAATGGILLVAGALVIAFEAIVQTIQAVDEEFQQLSRDLAKFSPEITAAASTGRIERTFAEMERARELGGDLGDFTAARNDINNSLYRIETTLLKLFTPFVAAVAEDLATLTEMAEDVVNVLDEIKALGPILENSVGALSPSLAILVDAAKLYMKLRKEYKKNRPAGKLQQIVVDFMRRFDGQVARGDGLPKHPFPMKPRRNGRPIPLEPADPFADEGAFFE